MATTLTIEPPSDYLLSRDVCSYGYFLLWPNHWDVKSQTLGRVLTLEIERRDVAVPVMIAQPRRGTASRSRLTSHDAKPGDPLRVLCHAPLTREMRGMVIRQITRMLRLEEPAETIAAFHTVDPRFAPSGRGRLFGSPTLFEDVLKTVTSCNVTWPGTTTMNRRLCQVLGPKARVGRGKAALDMVGFPSARKLSRTRPTTLRARCRVGYRDRRIVELASLFAKGKIDVALLEDPARPSLEVFKYLQTLPGVGPYAAANIMQLLGRHDRLPLDTESVRHGKLVLGYRGTSAQIMKQVHEHYAPIGSHAFRSYWFELWEFYERKAGPSPTWERETTGQMFTAALLSKD